MNQNGLFYAYMETFKAFYLIMINYVAYREVKCKCMQNVDWIIITMKWRCTEPQVNMWIRRCSYGGECSLLLLLNARNGILSLSQPHVTSMKLFL